MDMGAPAVPCRSPWLDQLAAESTPRPLRHDVDTDVAIIGAGIAGVATAFFVLRNTTARVLLIEGGRAARGATGHNAGQLASYFERPLCDLVEAYGFEQAMAAQGDLDASVELLQMMVRESRADVRIDYTTGHMGMFTLNHLEVHLSNQLLRQAAGLELESCVVSEEAPFLADIPDQYSSLYAVVPHGQVREMLNTSSDSYYAVLSAKRACANSAHIVEQVLASLLDRHNDRFEFADHTKVTKVRLEADHADIHAGGHRVRADRVVMCTNGFIDHIIENVAGDDIVHSVERTVGYMAGFLEDNVQPPGVYSFIRNAKIGGTTPYVYVTRRPFEIGASQSTLTCFGGPERGIEAAERYVPESSCAPETYDEFDRDIRPLIHRSDDGPIAYAYRWHGVMAYTPTRVRMIGFEPRNPVLMYNLGCNGVGFLPSIYGGHRIARMLAGDDVEPSIFDPV